MKPKAKAKGKSPRQKKLLALLPTIAEGKISIQEAMVKAGYSAETARQQRNIMRGVRNTTEMQKALLDAGFNEELIAEKVMEGLAARGLAGRPDHQVRHKFLETGAKLLDAFPAQKSIHALTEPEALLDQSEAEALYAPWEEPKDKA